jgi:hypothetical protein
VVPNVVIGHHLQQRRTCHEVPTGSQFVGLVFERCINEQPDRAARPNQSGQRRVAPLPMLTEGAQRSNLANKPPRLIEALGKLRVPRSQSLPDDIVEWMHTGFDPDESLEVRLILDGLVGYPKLARKLFLQVDVLHIVNRMPQESLSQPAKLLNRIGGKKLQAGK